MYFSLFQLEMEVCKILLAAIFVVTLSSVSRTAPLNSPPNKVEILIRLGLSPELTNATKEVRNLRFNNTSFIPREGHSSEVVIIHVHSLVH